MASNTALLFFSRTAHAEAGYKQFSKNNRKVNVAITTALVLSTRQLLTSCQVPVFEINENQQSGSTFGERLANSIEKIFGEGFDNVVVLGNDCPALTATIIQNAIKSVEENKLVLGPDTRGGVFLMGINKHHFNKQTFINYRWQSGNLYTDIEQSYGSNNIALLPVLPDANNIYDLSSLIRFLSPLHKLKQLVRSIIASFIHRIFHYNSISTRYCISLFGLRGPPKLVA